MQNFEEILTKAQPKNLLRLFKKEQLFEYYRRWLLQIGMSFCNFSIFWIFLEKITEFFCLFLKKKSP